MPRLFYLLTGLLMICYALFTVNNASFIARLNGQTVKNSTLNNLSPGKYNIDLIIEDLPKNFIFRVDDCIQSLEVNGNPVKDFNFPYCDYSKVASIPLEDFPSLPLNKISASIENHYGPGNFIPLLERETYRRLSNYLFFSVGFFLLFSSFFYRTWSYHYLILLLIGLLSRSLVAALVPLDFRSSDFSGHVEHAVYVIKNFTIPPVSECWECYQPPAFYFLSALFVLAFNIDTNDFQGLGLFPLLLSFFTCIISIMLFRLWITDKKSAFYLLPFLLLPGVLNTEISFNNDSLVTLTSLLILLLGSLWFKTSKSYAFWVGAILVPIGILSKLSVLAAAVTWFLMLLARKSYKRIAFSGLVAFVIAAPYFLYRHQTENKVEMIGNIGNLNSQMSINVTPKTFYSLDIPSMIRNPFADPWVEGFHRQSFPEYAFLSGVFFEARRLTLLPAQASIALLVFSLLVTLICLLIRFRSVVRPNWPILVGVFLQVVSLAANLIVHPFACCANFRFIAPIGILLGIAFAVILERQPKFLRISLLSTATLGMLCAWFAILTTKQ